MNYVEIYETQITPFKFPLLLNHQVKNGVYSVKARCVDTCLPELYIYKYIYIYLSTIIALIRRNFLHKAA